MSDVEQMKAYEAHARARERREIAAALAWNNAQSVMPEEWHEAMDSAIKIALDLDSVARREANRDPA